MPTKCSGPGQNQVSGLPRLGFIITDSGSNMKLLNFFAFWDIFFSAGFKVEIAIYIFSSLTGPTNSFGGNAA
jgi:hypothetical protein